MGTHCSATACWIYECAAALKRTNFEEGKKKTSLLQGQK
jgi:hypothetical protein